MLKKQISKIENGPSILTIYIGFKKSPKEIGNNVYSKFIFDNSISGINDLHENSLADFDKRSFVFVDYSQIDSALAPEGKALGVICTMDYISNWNNLNTEEYRLKKEEVATIFIDRLNIELPGIKELIGYVEVATPKTIERYTLNPDGSPYGFAQTVKQSARNRINNKSKIPNLFYASAWTSPGGGFSGAILAGYTCALKVKKELS
ncbi:MAG: hypothetical protein JXR51_16440 [Bacteroidales bacterium]|nr:hypothetical protein [Bacteroidales bacterium]MBN2758756.1 hypothetical protein [Bacteroidales bacterium]